MLALTVNDINCTHRQELNLAQESSCHLILAEACVSHTKLPLLSRGNARMNVGIN